MYQRVYAKINLDIIIENIRGIRKQLNDETKLLAVIKADAYGHGAIQVAKALENERVDYFAVAIIQEAVELRKNSIDKPILLLGYTNEQYDKALLEYNIIPTVFRYERAKALSDMAVHVGKQAKIHIKLETGMSRIGFLPNDKSLEEIERISKLPNIIIEGIFTHLSCADMLDKSYAERQVKRYNDFIEKLEKHNIYIPIKHCANSAAILEMPHVRHDMVRCGIITYGLYPSEEVSKEIVVLKPALELKSNIVYIKELEEGIGVGYGATYITTQKTLVATIPVGYADGMSRSLSSKGRVLIRGQYAPILGRICMDQFMVDVNNIEGVQEGDEVTIIGKNGDKIIPIEEIANLAGSFNYEYACDISKRVPRVYIKDGKISEIVDYLDKDNSLFIC